MEPDTSALSHPFRQGSLATHDVAKVVQIIREASSALDKMSAEQRIAWTLETFPNSTALSTSFGAQAAVLLHMVTSLCPTIPVIFVDTGYHFQETYHFADQLAERLNLNLRIYQPNLGSAWQEARYGLSLQGM